MRLRDTKNDLTDATAMRILLIEDEKTLASVILQALDEAGIAADAANDGRTGLAKAKGCDYDALILDLMLPALDGLSLLAALRSDANPRRAKTPVLILTARDAVPDRVKGLDSGADDYLIKPFDLDELIARVRALVRRASDKPDPVITVGDVRINTASRSVTRAGRSVPLTAKEYALAELLALHRDTLVTRTQIYDHIYDETDDSLSNVVDVYVSNLRKKLGKDFVQTRRGMGYIAGANPEPE